MFDAINVAEMFTKLEANGYNDVCTVTRRTGGPSWDYDNDTQTDASVAIIYSGPCRVHSTTSSADEEIVGLQHAYLRRLSVVLPYSESLDFSQGDTIRVDESVLDPYMAGIDFVVSDVVRSSWKVDIKLTANEVEAPDGVA